MNCNPQIAKAVLSKASCLEHFFLSLKMITPRIDIVCENEEIEANSIDPKGLGPKKIKKRGKKKN